MKYIQSLKAAFVALGVVAGSQMLDAQKLFSSTSHVFSFNTGDNTVDTLGAFGLQSCYGPKGRLVHIGNGELIGITEQSPNLYGAVYKTDTATGAITVLLEFTNNNRPQSSFVLADNGKLYCLGYTGTSNESRIYSFDPANNSYVNEYEITGNAQSGIFGGMVKAPNGILYGVTQRGGANDKGMLFSFNTANNAFTSLYDFTLADGCNPEASMIVGANGKLYGVTTYGGANDKGVIFSYDITGNVYTKLFDFVQSTGECPTSPMFQASDGKLYGVTMTGGGNYQGTLYSYDLTSGTYTALHSFFATDGYGPRTTPTEVSGIIYGNCNQGGVNYMGSVYSYNMTTMTWAKLMDGSSTSVGSFTVPFYNFNAPAVGIDEEENGLNSSLVYPNPVVDQGTLRVMSENFTGQALVSIFDLSGRLIRSTEITVTNGEGKMPVTHEEFSAGMYVYSVYLQNGETLNGKFNIQ